MPTQQLTNKQLETRIHTFLARKTHQFNIEDPLKHIEPQTRTLLKRHTTNVQLLTPQQITA